MNSFEEGRDSSKLTSRKQALLRALVTAVIIVISFFNSFPIYVRIIFFIFLMWIFGMIASAKKLKNKI